MKHNRARQMSGFSYDTIAIGDTQA